MQQQQLIVTPGDRWAGRSACSGLLATPLAQPPGRAWRQRLPARYDARTLPRLHVVRDAGKQPAQLDRGRQLALLLECSADCSGFRFGHDEHAGSMVTRAVTGKLLDISLALPVLQHRVDTAPQPPEFLEALRHEPFRPSGRLSTQGTRRD